MWGWRRLQPAEVAWVLQCFGTQQGRWLQQQIRVGVRRVGDTRRALCLNGGWVSLPRACFTQGDGAQPLRLDCAPIAALLAHELLHQLQRRQGLPVTRQSAWLQCVHLCGGRDPYAYVGHASPRAMLRQFWSAQVEQQAQMWQDHVQAWATGTPLPWAQGMVRAVQAGRLRRRSGR